MADLWNSEVNVSDLDIDVPNWIDQDIDCPTVAAIIQGGCASGAYMPAVTYHKALDTMSDYGDDVLQYIEGAMGELPDVSGQSWAQMACTYLSTAVELWASSVESEIESALYEREEEAEAA